MGRPTLGNIAFEMIPVIVVFFGHHILPEWVVTQALAAVPWRASPYQALLLGIALVYLPFGLNLLLKLSITNGKIDNVNPRKQTESIAISHPAVARLSAAEKNQAEGFPLFAAAVLAALQAGVSRDVVSLYATFWLIARLVFIFIYAVQTNATMAATRSLTWVMSIAVVS